jgi:pimeloyl-ACP methyl ester carboxylesterase
VKRPFVILLVIYLLIALSCQNQGTRKSLNASRDILEEKGKVIPDIACLKNPDIRYSLYLPSGYTTSAKFPLILAFDPHGSGNLPVEQYKSLAERYGYILMGSNNSKNGLPMNETESIITSMFEEITDSYPIDTSRIYLMGFSGGARIASLVALYYGGVKGVIGCGAGFPGTNQPGRFRFDYIGFAGNADFNMNELVSLDEQLEEQGFRHSLIIFDGKHEWPPAEIMEYAFIWNDFCARKDGKNTVSIFNDDFFAAMINKALQEAEVHKSLYEKKLALQQMIQFEKGLVPVDHEQMELARLLSSEAYKKEEKKINALRDKERQEQQMFNENFYVKDLSWWKNKIKNYELRITTGADKEDELMCKRIISYLSLLAYMNYTGATNAGATEKADFALEVYRIVDPENAAKIK